jgi:hypothetical protein
MKPIKGGKHPDSNDEQAARTLAGIFQNMAAGNSAPVPPDLPYSEMLIQLVQPYMAEEPEIEELEEKLELGQIAWNLSVMKQKDEYLYQNYRENFLATELDENTQDFIDKLVLDKEARFGEYDAMLDDCEVIDDEEGHAGVHVSVKSYEQFMQDILLNSSEEEDDEEDEEEGEEYNEELDEESAEDEDDVVTPEYVNRSSVVVLPKPAFSDWARKTFPEDELSSNSELEKNMYLINCMDENSEFDEWLKNNYEYLFENELYERFDDNSLWPDELTYELFNQWFDVQFYSVVYDTKSADITKV